MNRSGQQSLRRAEDAAKAGADDLALLHLWNALEQARAFDDRETMARVRLLARGLAPRTEEAVALATAAERALAATAPADRGRPEAAAPAPERVEEEQEREQDEVAHAPPRTRVPRALGALLLALLVAVNVALRLVIDDSDGDQFRAPEIEVVPNGEGYASRRPVVAAGLFLVPVDGTADALIGRTARTVEAHYPVVVRVLPRIRSERRTFDEERDQLEGEAVIDELFRAYPSGSARTVVVGVTNYDLFCACATDDRYAFAVRAADRYGIVSTARMDETNYGHGPHPELLRRRVAKMVLRIVGLLYFGLPRIANERSVLRDSIRSVDDLDEMTTWFCPDEPRAVRGC